MANIRRLLVTILTMLGMILLNLLKVLVGAPDSNESMANIRRLLDTIMTIEGVILFNVLKVLVGAPGRNESIANIRRLSVTVLTMLGMIPLKALVDAPYSNESSLATVNPVTTVDPLPLSTPQESLRRLTPLFCLRSLSMPKKRENIMRRTTASPLARSTSASRLCIGTLAES